jgi:prepilin-type N-terminal cleavage/methylation domain-containing protein
MKFNTVGARDKRRGMCFEHQQNFIKSEGSTVARPGILMKDSNRGFTLIELLITIAIVGILASVAMPLFQMHIIRSKLTEAENAMANVKSAVSTFRQDTETWPTCPTVNEIRNSLGVGLGSIDRISQISIDANGIITATINNIHPTVDGQDLILRPTLSMDGSISWIWDCSPGFPTHLKPRG